MISMARGLRLNVVAEGVEMPDQEAFLTSCGCDIVQGYLYSRPVPATQLEPLLPRLASAEKARSFDNDVIDALPAGHV
jgi:EAL domain-containing protein (putative c-di-GMP-specific phosphodiesterase class I)